jgi:hypothetical protein
MTIPEEQKSEIVEGLLQMLDPEAVEVHEEIKQMSASDLMTLHGIFHTHDGTPLLHGILYAVSTSQTRKVNHRQKIGQIIADSANMEEVTERLGQHLAKYAKDREAVRASIPTISLLIHKIKPEHEN